MFNTKIFLFNVCMAISTCLLASDLHQAVAEGNLEKVKNYIELWESKPWYNLSYLNPFSPEGINGKDKNAMTPLHILCQTVDSDDFDDSDYSPRDSSSENYENDMQSIAELLVKKGAGLEVKNKAGKTPMDLLWPSGTFYYFSSVREKIIKMLVANGAKNNDNLLRWMALVGSQEITDFLIKKWKNLYAKSENNYTLLHAASSSKHPNKIETVKFLIEAGVDVNIKTKAKITPLHLACEEEVNIDKVKYLIQKGANIEAQDEENETPLHLACRPRYAQDVGIANNFRGIKYLIENNANIKAKNNKGETPFDLLGSRITTPSEKKQLSRFCMKLTNNMAISADLIKQFVTQGKLDLTAKDKNERTLLHWICLQGDLGITDFLLKNSANPNAKDICGKSPLHLACINGLFKIAEILIKHNAALDIKDCKKWTPLHYACEKEDLTTVMLLIEKGANPRISDDNKKEPFDLLTKLTPKRRAEFCIELIKKNNKTISSQIRKLAKYDLETYPKDTDGNTLLHLACEQGDLDLVFILISKKAGINTTNNLQETPLHSACKNGHLKIAHLLIENGAQAYSKNKNGSFPFELIGSAGSVQERNNLCLALLKYGDNNAIQQAILLVNENINITMQTAEENALLFWSCRRNQKKILEKLLKNGSNPNILDQETQWTPLHLACLNGFIEAAKLLIDYGAKINVCGKDNETPVQLASGQNLKLTKLLIENNANINIKNSWGFSTLHIAAVKNKPDIAEFLIKKGAHVHEKNMFNRTPLDEACIHGNLDIIKVLINNGVQINLKNNSDGKTSLHNACEIGKFDVVITLIEQGANTGIKDINGKVALDYMVKKLTPKKRTILLFTLLNSKQKNILEHLEIFIKLGIDYAERDNDGNTIFHYASKYCLKDLVIWLIKQDISYNVVNLQNETPCDIAKKNNFTDIITLLK